jgi:hypothetical protein
MFDLVSRAVHCVRWLAFVIKNRTTISDLKLKTLAVRPSCATVAPPEWNPREFEVRARISRAHTPLAAITTFLLFHTWPLVPAYGQDFTQAELRALPRVCHAQRFINEMLQVPIVPEPEREQFESVLGPDYIHYHHHCYALIHIKRANGSSNPQNRSSNYHAAINNFAYVQRNASAAFPLLPDVCLQKGFAYRLIGSDAEAAREFVLAMRLKPDYTPAYGALIDYYLDLGALADARSTVLTGLQHAPSSKLLQQKQIEIEAMERKRAR